MRVLVTGGAGFIGGHVVRNLLAEGDEVIVLDSLLTGSQGAVPKDATFVRGDIRDRAVLDGVLHDMDAVVHLAALVSVAQSVRQPEETRAVNVEGTKDVFAAALQRKVGRVVYASSAAVYGNVPGVPKREDAPLRPDSPYANSKCENERQAPRLPSAAGLRFFNVYGPGQHVSSGYAAVIPRFIEAARAGRPLRVEGGNQTRDFVHVRDVARAVSAAVHSTATGVFNVASGVETSIRTLAEIVNTRYPVGYEQVPSRPGDIERSVADCARARHAFGWEARISLKDGIQELLL